MLKTAHLSEVEEGTTIRGKGVVQVDRLCDNVMHVSVVVTAEFKMRVAKQNNA
jgi:hypothetical protein